MITSLKTFINNVKPNQTFHFTRCLTPKRVANS